MGCVWVRGVCGGERVLGESVCECVVRCVCGVCEVGVCVCGECEVGRVRCGVCVCVCWVCV